MEFDVYCDESRPDLFASKAPQSNYMVIGSLWLPKELRNNYKNEIHSLREKYKIGPEFKWQKISNSRVHFYNDLIDWFFSKGEDFRFRCIVVDANKVDLLHYHENDQELGFYKFYYQMLHHWILDFNEYNIFCDAKKNAKNDRLKILAKCLGYSNLSSSVKNVQAIRSDESVLIQLSDVLTGLIASRMNCSLKTGSVKEQVLKHFESVLGKKICATSKTENKLNVFVIDLRGGW